MQRVLRGLAVTLIFAPSIARAELDPSPTPGDGETRVQTTPAVSNELLDPVGYSRFHLVTRASFSDGNGVFTDTSSWSYEARVHIRIIEGLALSATFPFGLYVRPGVPKKFFFGNFNLGVAGGGRIPLGEVSEGETRPRLRIGGAFELYAPTTPEPSDISDPLFAAESAVAFMRSLEPWLYLNKLMSFRARANAGITIEPLRAELELGITPAFTLESSSEFLAWISVAARASVLPIPEIEPYLEAGSAIQVAGPGEYSPPFLLTPGVRFHVGGFDPAIFLSFNFKTSSAIIFGVDIAGIFVPTRRGEPQGSDDFLNFD